MIKMKAVTLNEYGNVDVLTYTMNAELPQLEDKDVLIEVKATSVNPVDWQIREGYLKESIPYEFPLILGWDAAGVVKMVGDKVTKFEVGDEVYSSPDMTRNGTYAEQVVVNENIVAKKPKILTFEEAATSAVVGVAAETWLISVSEMKQEDSVLSQAAAGRVGSFAIKLAKAKVCWLAATSCGDNEQVLEQLGANQVINYEQ